MLTQHPFCSVFKALSSCRIILCSLKVDLSSLQTRASDFGFVFFGWGGGQGGMMTTLLRRHLEQYLQKRRFSQYLQYFRDVGPFYFVTKPTSGRSGLDLGILEALQQ